MTTLTMNARTYTVYDSCARQLAPCLVVVSEAIPDGEIRVDEQDEQDDGRITDGLE